MSHAVVDRAAAREQVLLGDEAVAQAALDAGITAAYAYPGTPSTEIRREPMRDSYSGSGTPAT